MEAEKVDDITQRRQREAMKKEKEQQMKKEEEQRRARKEQEEKLARKKQERKLAEMKQNEAERTRMKQQISQEEKHAIAEFLARKEDKQRIKKRTEEHAKMMEKHLQEWFATMQWKWQLQSNCWSIRLRAGPDWTGPDQTDLEEIYWHLNRRDVNKS